MTKHDLTAETQRARRKITFSLAGERPAREKLSSETKMNTRRLLFFRPLSGKTEENILCELCGSAVEISSWRF